MSDIEVSFPAPCSQSWDAMEPRGCNRHCAACDQVIHDLSEVGFEEALSLLDAEACVRAKITAEGTVALAGNANRRLFAAVAAPLGLALAACSTTGLGEVTPRYEITGKTRYTEWGSVAVLTDPAGREWRRNLDSRGAFRFSNLHATTYKLTIERNCGEPIEVGEVVVREEDVGLSELDWPQAEDCIIIGVFRRVEPRAAG